MSVYRKYVLFVGIFAGCVYQSRCEFRIDFLKVCSNHQVQPIECPKNITRALDINSSRILEPASFNVGNTWHNHTELIGNLTFHLGKRRNHVMEMTLLVHGHIKDSRCFTVLQPPNTEYVNMSCLRMVPSNFAQIEVILYQNVSVCGNQTRGMCNKTLVQTARYLFNIGQESCGYYNKKLGVSGVRRFTGWTSHQNHTLEFQYFDSSINIYAALTEMVITEMCINRLAVVYNKTLTPGQNRALILDRFEINCPADEHLEIIAETCSYCHKSHEDTECFHRDLEWIDKPLMQRDCEGCSLNADCIHQHCICRVGYHGNGYRCLLNHKEKFLKDAIIGVVVGTLLIVSILAVIVWITTKKVKCKKLKCLFSPQDQFHQCDFTFNKEQEILIQNNQLSTPPAKNNKIVVLFHPDTSLHKQHVHWLVRYLQYKKYCVLGCPDDYQANWVKFAESVVKSVCDVVIVLSPNFCELCKLYGNQHSRNNSEEVRWQMLLEQRQHDCVPCIAMESLQRRCQNGSQEEVRVHIVTFQNESTKSSRNEITESQTEHHLYNKFVENYNFLRENSSYHKIFRARIPVSDLMCAGGTHIPLESQLIACPNG